MAGTVLCIDDEPSVLKTLQRVLMPCVEEIVLAHSGSEALSILEERSVDLVICDMRMPGMDGYETLQAVRKAGCRATRVVLSGYTTKETMLKTVLDGTASLYVQKPWNSQELQKLVRHLLAIRKELDREGLQQLFANLNGLPGLPELYRKVVDMIARDSTAAEIAEMIERDPAYAARILRVANSAIHGVSIGSVRQAVVYLGLNTIKNIILTCEVFGSLVGSRSGIYGVESLWVHSNLCNLAVSSLYRRRYDKPIGDEIASAGLLHDIGKFLMIKHFPEACRTIEAKCNADADCLVCDEERRVLGFSHTELGGLLLDWWNLPAHVVEGCLFHHSPLDERVHSREWLALLRIADYLAWIAQGEVVVPPTAEELAGSGFGVDILQDQEILETLQTERFELSQISSRNRE